MSALSKGEHTRLKPEDDVVFKLGMPSRVDEETVFKRMRLAICSGNRRRVLLALKDGKKTLSDVREEVPVDPPTIVHALRELEHYRLVEQDELREYSLTVIGKALVQKVIDRHRSAHVLTSHEAFWFEHDLSGIPDDLFSRIGLLQDSDLVADGQAQVLRGLTTFTALIEDADLLKIITPFYSLRFVDRLDVFASKGKEWHFIVTDDVLQSAMMDEEHLNVKALLHGNAEFRVVQQDPKLFFASADDAIALALATVKGQLDYSTLLVCRGSDATAWGRELFDYYYERSVVVNELASALHNPYEPEQNSSADDASITQTSSRQI